MELIFEAIFFAAFLVTVSMLAGMFSTRIGAPLLLVFLGLGMLAGVDGLGHIEFNDFKTTWKEAALAPQAAAGAPAAATTPEETTAAANA